MNILLSKHRPKDCSKEQWVKTWDNMGYGLTALYNAIIELENSVVKVKEDDFSIANHYALLAYQAGKRAAYQEIRDFLPDSAKKDV